MIEFFLQIGEFISPKIVKRYTMVSYKRRQEDFFYQIICTCLFVSYDRKCRGKFKKINKKKGKC